MLSVAPDGPFFLFQHISMKNRPLFLVLDEREDGLSIDEVLSMHETTGEPHDARKKQKHGGKIAAVAGYRTKVARHPLQAAPFLPCHTRLVPQRPQTSNFVSRRSATIADVLAAAASCRLIDAITAGGTCLLVVFYRLRGQ